VATVCGACGQRIECSSSGITVLPEGRQVIDLPPTRFEVTEHSVQIAQCLCGLSDAIPAVAVGPIAQALEDLFGLRVTTGTVQHSIDHVARVLAPAIEQIRQAFREQPVVQSIETIVERPRAANVDVRSGLSHLCHFDECTGAEYRRGRASRRMGRRLKTEADRFMPCNDKRDHAADDNVLRGALERLAGWR
jgi:hypothetical protein